MTYSVDNIAVSKVVYNNEVRSISDVAINL